MVSVADGTLTDIEDRGTIIGLDQTGRRVTHQGDLATRHLVVRIRRTHSSSHAIAEQQACS